VLFVLANLRRDWHMTAKNPGAFLMGLLQHRWDAGSATCVNRLPDAAHVRQSMLLVIFRGWQCHTSAALFTHLLIASQEAVGEQGHQEHILTLCCDVLCCAVLSCRAALIGGSGLSRKLLETARNFPNVAVYIDSDVLQVR
jgi:hypothetical protein